ncbi:MAG: Stage II sporulation protein D, partial [uncultured Gemmatimonadetes bacterium]
AAGPGTRRAPGPRPGRGHHARHARARGADRGQRLGGSGRRRPLRRALRRWPRGRAPGGRRACPLHDGGRRGHADHQRRARGARPARPAHRGSPRGHPARPQQPVPWRPAGAAGHARRADAGQPAGHGKLPPRRGAEGAGARDAGHLRGRQGAGRGRAHLRRALPGPPQRAGLRRVRHGGGPGVRRRHGRDGADLQRRALHGGRGAHLPGRAHRGLLPLHLRRAHRRHPRGVERAPHPLPGLGDRREPRHGGGVRPLLLALHLDGALDGAGAGHGAQPHPRRLAGRAPHHPRARHARGGAHPLRPRAGDGHRHGRRARDGGQGPRALDPGAEPRRHPQLLQVRRAHGARRRRGDRGRGLGARDRDVPGGGDGPRPRRAGLPHHPAGVLSRHGDPQALL